MKKKTYFNFSLYGLMCAFSTIIIIQFTLSCKKNTNDQELLFGKKALIKVKVSNTSFLEESSIASTKSNSITTPTRRKHYSTEWDDEYMLVAELSTGSHVNLNKPVRRNSNNISTKASSQQLSVAPNVRYVVHIFDEGGTYVDSRKYTIGKENETKELLLDGDKEYTFVALSINTAAEIADLTFDNKKRSIENAQFNISGSGIDLMYYKKIMRADGNSENLLDINFNHAFSQITSIIETGDVNQSIKAIQATLNPTNSGNVVFNLANNSVSTVTERPEKVYFSYNGINTATVSSKPVIVNPNNRLNFSIESISINNRTRKQILVFELNVVAGQKYTIRWRLERRDRYGLLNADGVQIPTVQIDGQIWMRQNVQLNKRDYNQNPDQNVTNPDLNGHYYVWGRQLPAALPNATAGLPTLGSYFQNNPPDQSGRMWNPLNTDTQNGDSFAPNETKDPCPKGFRVPSVAEVNRLLSNVTSVWQGSSLIFTSKQNNSIKMIIPAQGYFPYNENNSPPHHAINGRGSRAVFWATHDGDDTTPYFFASHSENLKVAFANKQDRRWAMPVRCIKW